MLLIHIHFHKEKKMKKGFFIFMVIIVYGREARVSTARGQLLENAPEIGRHGAGDVQHCAGLRVS